jgi:transcription elongation GreA/GreB family factor
MNKTELLRAIVAALSDDLGTHMAAALAAHEAATHEECIPDNKYDTTALEASYIAQGQANRAQEIRVGLESYRQLKLQDFADESPIRLTALVDLEDDEGNVRRVFLGPHAGGMKVCCPGGDIVIITPGSPLGRELLGKVAGDEVSAGERGSARTYTVAAVS